MGTSEIKTLCVKNAHYVCHFDAGTGALLEMRAHENGPVLVQGVTVRYRQGGCLRSDRNQEGQGLALDVVWVKEEANAIVSLLRADGVEIRRSFTFEPGRPVVGVVVEVRSTGFDGELAEPRFPHIRFADDFVNLIEGDEPDLFFDGAELGGGRELPCWRVFMRSGCRDGVLMAARSKAMMSHMQIWPREEKAVDCRPHVMCAYDEDYGMFNSPMRLSPSRAYKVELEIGPWRADRHARLLDDAGLLTPGMVQRNHIPRQAKRSLGGSVYFAADVAPAEAVSHTYDVRRWLVSGECATVGEKCLFANAGTRPPMIRVSPGLTGPHRVLLGVGTGYCAMAQVQGEPEARYRFCSQNTRWKLPFALHMGAQAEPGEVDFGVVDMTGKTVDVGAVPSRLTPGIIDYIRFVPLLDAQAVEWKCAQDKKPCVPLSGFADIFCVGNIWGDSENPGPEPYRAMVWAHANAGFNRIFWRIDGECTDFPTRTATRRPVCAWTHGAYLPQARAYGLAVNRNDLLRTAIDAGEAHGVGIWGWMRFNAYFSGVRSEFFRSHPEYWDHSESGQVLDFKLCLAFEEVRRHKINILVEAARYPGLGGLNLGFLRHPPIVNYHPVLVQSYRARYGEDPPRKAGHGDFYQHRNQLPEDDDAHVRWYRHRAQVMTQFGRELRQELRVNGLGHTKIAISVRPRHCLFDGIDIDAWLQEGLCDEVVAGPYWGDQELMVPTPQWKGQVQARVPLTIGTDIIERSGMVGPIQAARLKAHYNRLAQEGYDGICTYESTDAVCMPYLLDIYHGLRGDKP